MKLMASILISKMTSNDPGL